MKIKDRNMLMFAACWHHDCEVDEVAASWCEASYGRHLRDEGHQAREDRRPRQARTEDPRLLGAFQEAPRWHEVPWRSQGIRQGQHCSKLSSQVDWMLLLLQWKFEENWVIIRSIHQLFIIFRIYNKYSMSLGTLSWDEATIIILSIA